jgi:hypothetical protein
MLGRFGHTCRAIAIGTAVIFKWRCAAVAPWWGQKLQLLPAIDAKWSASGRYRAATWAAFGQRPIERSTENVAGDGHEDLSDKASVCTRPK